MGLLLPSLSRISYGEVPKRIVQEISADDQCGQDRRCRIERLRKLNQQRRVSQERSRSQRAMRFQDRLSKKDLEASPREKYPFTVDIEAMTGDSLSLAGFGGTWQWLEHLRIIGAFYPTCDVSSSYSSTYEAYLSGRCIKGGVRYLNGKKALTTYFDLYAMHMLMKGDISTGSYYYDEPVFGGTFDEIFDTPNASGDLNEYGELEAHVLGFGAGIDWMIGQRFHFKLGLATNYVLFASLRDERTRANLIEDNTEQVLMSEVMSFSFDLSLGYAF